MNDRNDILQSPRRTRGLRQASAVACVAAACLTMSSAIVAADSASAGSPEVSAAAIPVEQGGRELVRGLFFLSGPVVELVPELREARDQVESAGHVTDPEVVSRIIDRIDGDDPRYLAQFAAAVQSGDHVAVRDAMSEAGDRIVHAAEQEFGVEPGHGPDQRLTVGLAVVLVAAMAVVSVAWLAGGVSVVITAMAPSVGFGAAGERRSVPADRAVDAIVRHLGPAST